MNRRTFIRSTVGFSTLAAIKSQAPIPVFLGLALKCVALSVIGGTAVILYRCNAKCYLVRYEEEGEADWYCASMTRVQSLGLGGRRCEGPWTDMAEPRRRAIINNAALAEGLPIIYPCGPLGDIPGPLPMPIVINLHRSDDRGVTFAKVGSMLGTDTDNAMFLGGFLKPGGTDGMSKTDLQQIKDCDVKLSGTLPPHKSFWRMSYENT